MRRMSQKLKIVDDDNLKIKLHDRITNLDKEILLDYSVNLIDYTFKLINYDYHNYDVIQSALGLFNSWRDNKKNLTSLRTAIFKVHQEAREEENQILSLAFRVTGHALATAHVVNHLEVSLDYMIKLMNVISNDDKKESAKLRLLQIKLLNKIIKKKQRA